jgi:hypothetical protein
VSDAQWLKAIGPAAKDALPALRETLRDPEDGVGAAARQAIKRIERNHPKPVAGKGRGNLAGRSSVMIPIPVFWTEYSATAQGRRLKFVPCENCSTEYVYVMQREATGAGTSMYMLNNERAADHATSAAGETLTSVLENDFDPVPCPVCGHYQRYMFPKLLGNTGLWVRIVLLVVIVVGCLAAVTALHRSVRYLQHRNDDAFAQLVTSWSVLLLLCITGFGLSIVNKVKTRRFNPNVGDPQARITLGRSRAATRAEFDKVQAGIRPG